MFDSSADSRRRAVLVCIDSVGKVGRYKPSDFCHHRKQHARFGIEALAESFSPHGSDSHRRDATFAALRLEILQL